MTAQKATKSFLDATIASLPAEIYDLLLGAWRPTKDVYPRDAVDALLRFAAGGSCPEHLRTRHSGAWKDAQTRLRLSLDELDPSSTLGKHSRIEAGTPNGEGASSSKKAKVDIAEGTAARGNPLYTLHAISVSSPIRKKVDLTITTTAILLTAPNASSADIATADLAAPPISLSSLKRAFLVSNLGKNRNKPHWNVILLPSDAWDKRDTATQAQVVFSVDHAPAAKDLLTTTSFASGGGATQRVAHPKGTETFPLLSAFLAHLPSTLSLIVSGDPSQSSSNTKVPFSSSTGHPYLEPYRAAKEGSLYFLAEGILWAECKPAEFFALQDIAPDSDDPSLAGVKTLSATGRTFSLYVRRWGIREKKDGDGDEDEDEEGGGEGEVIDETEFAMIEGREQENVMQWVRRYKRFFGVKPESQDGVHAVPNGKVDKGKGKADPQEVDLNDDDSDTSDEDFVASSSDEDESDSDENSSEGGDNGGDADEAESEGEGEGEGGSGTSGEDGDGGEEISENEVMDLDEEEMTAERHPLLRPGAMPRMSKAAMDMAAAMVTDAFVGSETQGDEEGDDNSEGDELDE